MSETQPLIIVSNRGPAQFDRDAEGERTISRGGGGLVTALTGLATHREVLWVASAMTEEDAVVAREADGPIEIELEGGSYEVEFVASDVESYELFYSVIANPQLWFVQHYLWDLSNAPDIRVEEKAAWRYGYKVVNADIAEAVIETLEGHDDPLVMFHDYHLYTAPALVREARPDVFLHHFVHIPWPHPDAWRILPRDWRDEIFDGLLSNDIIGFHTSPTSTTSWTRAASSSTAPRSTIATRSSATTAARSGSVPTRWGSTPNACAGSPPWTRSPTTSASCWPGGGST